MDVEIRGGEELQRRLRLLSDHTRFQAALKRKVKQIVMRVRAMAVRLAPIKHGYLRGGATHELYGSGDELGAHILFGGLAEAYAEVQHEHDEFEHPKGGQSHFLYGASDSAWTDAEQTVALRGIEALAERFMNEAAGGHGA